MTDGVRIEPGMLRRWAELALTVRAIDELIHKNAEPRPGSDFRNVDDAYPREAFSQWVREGVRSAVDHLRTWANLAIPRVQPEGLVIEHEGFRWTYTLMRGAIEGSAQSLWLSQSQSIGEAKARLVRMIRHDLREQRSAWKAMGRDTSPIEERLAAHKEAASHLIDFGPDVDKLPAMVDMVRAAAAANQPHASADSLEANWRVCSAAAHGKDWAILELQTFTSSHEWRPGQFHMTGHPDPDRLTEVLGATVDLLSAAAVKYVQGSGIDPDVELRIALIAAARTMQQKDGGLHVENMAKLLGVKSESRADADSARAGTEPDVAEVQVSDADRGERDKP